MAWCENDWTFQFQVLCGYSTPSFCWSLISQLLGFITRKFQSWWQPKNCTPQVDIARFPIKSAKKSQICIYVYMYIFLYIYICTYIYIYIMEIHGNHMFFFSVKKTTTVNTWTQRGCPAGIQDPSPQSRRAGMSS